MKFFSLCANVTPQALTDLLSNTLGWLGYHVIRFRRGVIEHNLTLAFGQEKSVAEIQRIALKNYQHYWKVFFEVLRSITWSQKKYLSQTHFVGMHHIESLLKEKKGAVFLGLHLGNWEIALAAAAVRGVPVDAVVKQAKSSIGQKFLDFYRHRFDLGVFFESNTVKEIFASLNSGRFITFILDQFMGPPIGVPVKFFGKEAGTAAGLALFCEKKEIAVFPAYNYRADDGKLYTVIEEKIQYGKLAPQRGARIYQRTQAYNDAIERIVKEHPEQWLWLHRRWKPFRGQSRWVENSDLAGVEGVAIDKRTRS